MINLLKPHVYRRQIIATGKYYIGKHIGTNKYYKGGGKDYKADLKIYVKHFDKDVITEILKYVDDVSELNEYEMYYLELVDASHNPLYYNRTNKSYGIDRKRTLEEKKIIGEKNKIHRIGKKISKQHKQKISQAKKGIPNPGVSILKGRISPNLGKKCSEYTKQIISKSNLGKKRPKISLKHKGRISPNLDKKWSEDTKLKNKGRKDSKETKILKSISKQKKIFQYDLENNFIKEWESGKKASEILNINNGNITNCVKGKYKTAGGFIWKYN